MRLLPVQSSALGMSSPWPLRAAWGGWIVLLAWSLAVTLFGPPRTVVPAYRQAAVAWTHSAPVYEDSGHGFLYFPQGIALFIPLAWCSQTVGEVGWRIVNLALFVAGLWRLAQLGGRFRAEQLFPLMTLLALPLAVSSARNGQATLAMTGAMMLAAGNPADRRWWTAAAWLSLGIAIKPLAVVMGLLTLVLYRPMRWRLIVGAAALAAAPFLTQWPEYVVSQHAACLAMLRSASDLAQSTLWAEPFSVLKMLGLDAPPALRTAVRLVAAVFTLSVCWIAMRRFPPRQAAVYLFSFAVAYAMLFNPRTENNTYIALAAAIGLFFAQACLAGHRRTAACLAALAIGIVSSRMVGGWFGTRFQAVWLAPIMGVCFLGYLVDRVLARDAEQATFVAECEENRIEPTLPYDVPAPHAARRSGASRSVDVAASPGPVQPAPGRK